MSSLSSREIERYQRHLTLPEFGVEAQEALKGAAVLMIGAGGLGCPALQYLAAAGVGTLGIVDDDVVARSNLQRQVLYTDADVGRPKAEAAAARLSAMNPDVRVRIHHTRLSAENAEALFRDYDLIIDGSDNFVTRYLVNDACVLGNKPLIYGAIQGFHGQASVFNYRGGPTYRCLFPTPPNPEDAPNCAELGVLGVLPGLIGLVQATEAIKVITGIGRPLSGVLLLWDALTMQQQRLELKRDPESAKVTELKAIEYQCGIPSAERNPDEISAQELQSRLNAGGAAPQLLDVREAWEREICHLPSSLHIPLGELQSPDFQLDQSELDPSRPTVVYCKAGARSMRALHTLRSEHGFSEILSLEGGILQWAEELNPQMARY
ncbi:MAG: molybdopterin-synthase adenylyltransferase MoeB [Puniceicoccaceae bacterium]|nr:MAG: molybdopterin-synthase adenylyltransferase MoeB [Puniceicoccaceae bacterium]